MPPEVAVMSIMLWAAANPATSATDQSVTHRAAAEDVSFGDIVVEAAARRLFLPYAVAPPLQPLTSVGDEVVEQRLDAFDCVTLVETALAEARCKRLHTPDNACFLAEIEGLRYVDGVARGYASRLHYFSDWLTHQAGRGRIRYLTDLPMTVLLRRDIFFMSANPSYYPPLRQQRVYDAITTRELLLSDKIHVILPRDQLTDRGDGLQNGDIVALLGRRQGILVSHVGLIFRDASDRTRFLHASSLAGVGVTADRTLQEYVEQGKWVQGIIVARPLPPREAPRAAGESESPAGL